MVTPFHACSIFHTQLEQGATQCHQASILVWRVSWQGRMRTRLSCRFLENKKNERTKCHYEQDALTIRQTLVLGWLSEMQNKKCNTTLKLPLAFLLGNCYWQLVFYFTRSFLCICTSCVIRVSFSLHAILKSVRVFFIEKQMKALARLAVVDKIPKK